jgi:hypothetical protein
MPSAHLTAIIIGSDKYSDHTEACELRTITLPAAPDDPGAAGSIAA